MSQPGDNNQYRTYNQSGPPKEASSAMANGETGITRHMQNGLQSTTLDSAGTPSSQSSHDPSRETSRDPSPTQYLNARYRPQLSRPPMPSMPLMNGQQSPLIRPPMPLQPNSTQPTRAGPTTQPQNPRDRFPTVGTSTSTMYRPPTNVPTSEPQIGGSMQARQPITLATHELSSPERRILEKDNREIAGEDRAMPPLFPQYGKNSPAIAADPSALERMKLGDRRTNPSTESNCNDRQADRQSFIVQSGVGRTVWSKDGPPASASNVSSIDARPTSQSHAGMFQQSFQSWNAPPTTRAQTSYLQAASAQSPGHEASRAGLIGPRTSTALPAVQHANMQNVFGNAPANENETGNQMALIRQQPQPQPQQQQQQPPPPKPPTLYCPTSDHQPNSYGYQQPNVAAQWNYGHSGHPTQYGTDDGMARSQPPQQLNPPYEHRPPQFGQMSNVPLDNINRRYPNTIYPDKINEMDSQMGNMNVTQRGFNELWGQQSIDLLQCRNVLPSEKIEPPRIKLHQEFLDNVNCSPDIFRCTLTKIPETNSLLQKCRLPLGVLIHPFKDLNHLPVIQCSTIVRCRACRTYINPFVYFVDSKRWKCNLCYRVNELPEEFQFDPVTKSYGDPSRRPEVKTSTIEFIAPSEYMLRPPQPAVYLFVLDVSRLAVDSGYLEVVCRIIGQQLDKLPGDGRTQVGFVAVDSAIHFFGMPENVSQPHEMIMLDVDDVFLPCPDNLIVNLKEREELVRDLLEQLPGKFADTRDSNSALGAGLQAAFKLMSPTGGRVTVFQTCLPNVGPGALQPREDPNARAGKDAPHLNPATDFYKRLALDCSGQQIAVDLFLLNSQYSDLATLSGMCKFSGGSIHHIPLFRKNKPQHSETLENMLRRYLTRKIGFEAVMRIRCTRGLSIHTFHGNFFVRSTDLLSLPNVNPDAGFGMQVSIEENLADVQSVCFQAALLYTSSKGERRIRVHTLCLPVSSSMSDILYSADQQAIIGLLSKMAVDRSQQSSLSDARDALINVAIDVLSAHKLSLSSTSGGLMAPANLKLLPLYIVALMKSVSFRTGTSTRLDDRVYAMCQMKALPLSQLMLLVYPNLYPVHNLDDRNCRDIDGKACPRAPRLHLSAEKLDFRGVFLMDAGDRLFIYIGKSVEPAFCNNVLGVSAYSSIPEQMYDLPELQTAESERIRNFVFSLQEEKPYYAPLQIIRDDSQSRSLFTDRLVEDRFENALSYYEFLQHLKTQVK